MFGKIFSIATSYLAGRFGQAHADGQPLISYDGLVDRATDRIKDIIQDTLLAAVAVIFIATGFFVAFFTILHQCDLTQSFNLNAVSIGALALMLIGAAGMYYVTSDDIAKKKKEAEEKKRKEIERTEQAKTSSISTIQNAVSLLVLDFIKEREFRRQIRSENQKLYESNVRRAYDRMVEQDINEKNSEKSNYIN